MSANDELRRMLDERGVEYDTRDSKGIKKTMESTYWDDSDGRRWGYTSDESGAIKDRQLFLIRGRMDFTPAQAIAATLGPKTCHEVKIDRHYRGCSECGYRWEYMYAVGWQIGPNFCPNCGAKVMEE